MPDKLAASDPKCPPGERELFVVEGDGAGGTAKKGRDSYYQEILPLRGKIINAMAHATAKVMGNTEVQALVLATGVKLDLRDHTKNDYSKLRVGKIILLADADPDGRHIESLVLAFVVQYAPELITKKMVYIAKSPLFRAVSRNGNQRWYADSLEGLEKKSGKKVAQMQIARLKGHGEASADDIAGYALSPATRKHILLSLESKCVKRVRGLMSEDVTAKKALMGIEETA